MAIGLSFQVESYPTNADEEMVCSIIDVQLAAPEITGEVPKDLLDKIVQTASKYFTTCAHNCGMQKAVVLNLVTEFASELSDNWSHTANLQDYTFSAGFTEDNGTSWNVSLSIVANCDFEQSEDKEVPVTLTKIPSNLH